MAKTIKVTLYHEKIDEMLNSPRGTVGREIKKRAIKVQAAAKRQVGIKTGRLQRSIRIYGHKKIANGQRMYIGSAVPYALMHHEGTKRHMIFPKKRSYLKFRSKGVLVFARAVNHPGTKPNRYLKDNLYLFYSK
jgi:hypothetical protein